MKANGFEMTEEKSDYNKQVFNKLATESDIQLRKELAQSVIDRLIDRRFGKEYLNDLIKLNYGYSLNYEIIKGVRVYTSRKETVKQTPSSSLTSELGKVTVGENADFSYHQLIEETIPQEQDIFLRAQLVQDCIDRMLDMNIGRIYLQDLLNLNKKYPVNFEEIKGAKVYSIMNSEEIELEKEVVGASIGGNSSGEVEIIEENPLESLCEIIKVFNVTENSSMIPDIKNYENPYKKEIQGEFSLIELIKPVYLSSISNKLAQIIRRDLDKRKINYQLLQIIENAYRGLIDKKPGFLTK